MPALVESSGLPGFSGQNTCNSPSEFGCAEACAGPSNNDFESMCSAFVPAFFVRQSDARTNTRADLMASRHCIVASPAHSWYPDRRESSCNGKRRKRLMESASSFSTHAVIVACEVEPKCGGADRSLSFKSGSSGFENWTVIHNCEANFLEEANQAIAVATDRRGRSMYGMSCRCYGRFALGQWVRFPQNLTCRRGRCIQATLFGKIDDLQFALLRVRIIDPKISPVPCLLCSMVQVEPWEANGS